MKYLSLLLPLFVLGSLFGGDDFAGTPAALGDAGHALASLEGDPNTIVHGSVNVITGDYVDFQTDVVLPGSEPLALQRFYCSANPPDGNILKVWPFNHFKEIGYTHYYEDRDEIKLYDSFGAVIPFEKKYVKQECLKKRVTNTPRGDVTGQTLLKNKRLSFQKNETILKDGAGTQSFFPKLRESSNARQALKVVKANGNQISYDYAKHKWKGHISKIKIDRDKKQLNHLNLNYSKGKNDRKRLTVSHQKLILASYIYEAVKYEAFDYEERMWEKYRQYLLKSVKRHQMPPEKYFYESLREPHPEPKKLIRKERPDGRFLEIAYFRKGDNAVWPGQNCAVEGKRIGRVMHLKAPAGIDGSTLPIYYFLYDTEERRTEVYDADGRRKTYHYNEEERLTKIETFEGNSPFYKFCEERFEWDGMNLTSKGLYDRQGNRLFCLQLWL